MTASPSPAPSNSRGGTPLDPSVQPANRHAPTPTELQRLQLAKLLKDPSKPVNLPAPPKEKTIRPPREMMKNVQGSSAGAGSGEFHVYKASRRREYERIKMMDEKVAKEAQEKEFEEKKRTWEEQAEAKTSKNRAKRQKKKERAKGKGGNGESNGPDGKTSTGGDAPLKKRRLVNGKEMVFRRPGEGDSDMEDEDGREDSPGPGPEPPNVVGIHDNEPEPAAPADTHKIIIHEDD